MNRLKELVPAITLSSILLAVWEIGARIVDEMYILPSPSAILMKIWKLKRHIIYGSFTCNVIRRFNRCCYLYRIRCRASDVNECEYMDGESVLSIISCFTNDSDYCACSAICFMVWIYNLE